jgi:hypothetical protein
MIGRALYHVPYSQVWEGSRSRQAGKVHLHVVADLAAGRLKRLAGRALCGRRGWYERPAEADEQLCPRCVELGRRYGVEWPADALQLSVERNGASTS